MTRSSRFLTWYTRLMWRSEDLALRRFGNLAVDQPKSAVPVFYARKAA